MNLDTNSVMITPVIFIKRKTLLIFLFVWNSRIDFTVRRKTHFAKETNNDPGENSSNCKKLTKFLIMNKNENRKTLLIVNSMYFYWF